MTAPWAKAYDDKLDLINWLKSKSGSRWVATMYSEINEGRMMGEDPLTDPYTNDPAWIDMVTRTGPGPGLAQELSDGETYWVSPDMTKLIDVAVHDEGFDMEQRLRPEDVPSPSGMVFFEHPMNDRIDTIDAISWFPSAATAGGIQLHLWMKPDRWRNRAERVAAERDEPHRMESELQDLLEMWFPKAGYILMDTHDWEFGEPASNLSVVPEEDGGIGLNEGAREILTETRRWIYGAMLMMQQKIALHHAERLPRHVIKRGIRAGLPDVSEIRCITLRREKIDPDGRYFGESGSINYSHRFMVSGHWKPQWYPSLGEHRVIYIAPYIKGPEDKPLIIKDTVYALRR